MEQNVVEKLMSEIVASLQDGTISIRDVYHMALSQIDTSVWKKEGVANKEELYANIAMGGFLVGVRFALENIEMQDDGNEEQ